MAIKKQKSVRLKVSTKIMGSFIILTILMAVVSFIGISSTNNAKGKYNTIINENLPVEELVLKVRSFNLEQVAAVRGYMLYKDESYVSIYNSLENELANAYAQIN